MTRPISNWTGNHRFEPAAFDEPATAGEVVALVRSARRAGQPVKALGAGHSFNDAASTRGRSVKLTHLNRVLDHDPVRRTVTVEAGIRLFELNRELARRGLALADPGDIDRQSIAGALATGTHGTGSTFGGLATCVLGFDLVTADGELARASTVEERELFHCGRVSLGALGIVTRCTLQCVPAFRLRMEERRCSVDELVRGFAGVVASNEYVEASWWPYADVCTLRCSNRTREPVQRATRLETWRDEVLVGNYFAGVLTEVGRVRPSLVPRILRSASGRAGRAHKVDWSPNVFAARRLVPFVTMEYAIARASLGPALLAVRELIGRERLTVDMPVVVRVAAADDVPLSTAFDRDSAYVAARVSAGRAHGAYFDGVEAIMEGLGGRPHWGAVHGQTAATLAPRYPEWERFRALRASLDPEGRFANAYTARVLGPPS